MTDATSTQHIPDDARDASGRFLKGKAPGRRPGSRNRVSQVALNDVKAIGPIAIARLKEKVNEGSLRAIEIVLSHILPKGGRCIDLSGSANPNDLIEAFCNAEISPDEFARASQAWKSAAEAADMGEIKTQLAELETIVTALQKR